MAVKSPLAELLFPKKTCQLDAPRFSEILQNTLENLSTNPSDKGVSSYDPWACTLLVFPRCAQTWGINHSMLLSDWAQLSASHAQYPAARSCPNPELFGLQAWQWLKLQDRLAERQDSSKWLVGCSAVIQKGVIVTVVCQWLIPPQIYISFIARGLKIMSHIHLFCEFEG